MSHGNRKSQLGTDFILVGLFQYGQMDALLFIVIAILFAVALLGNITLVLLIRLDRRLHTPMYFLLSQLSIIDMMYISTTVPKMAANFLSDTKTISFLGCKTQTFVFLTLGGSEALLLGFMSYDRYIAICRPLHYPVLMSRKICCSMVSCAWSSSSFNALIHTLYVFQLPFCQSRKVNHFFCEVPSLLPLVCEDTSQYEHTVLMSGLVILLLPFLAILASYARVLVVVFQMRSGKGQSRALSTCSSHLTVASMFYATGLSTYTQPHSLHSPSRDKVLAVFYSIVTPVLNPFIYSLRNKGSHGGPKETDGIRILRQKTWFWVTLWTDLKAGLNITGKMAGLMFQWKFIMLSN